MKRICLIVTSFVMLCLFVGCGQSYEETKRISRTQRLKAMREDSAALKIAVMPTLDCLPVYLAEDHHLFDSVVDIRLKAYTAHMDIDTALTNRRVELGFTDLVRAERMKKQGAKLEYLSATNAYWMLVTNRTARITNLKHLDDKMIAMTRYSVTDLLAELAVDSAELKSERVFRIQINDVNVRLKMLENNEMDALLLTEPQLTQAVAMKARPLLDTRKLDMCMGAIVKQEKNMDDSKRKQQLDAFVKGYNRAADSINKYGVGHYADLVVKYCRVKQETVKALPITLKFNHIAPPREQDIERAQKWVEKH
ncbi:MAG: ABC transporter substrate-binding protein [Prevotella sp.]|nr:ABC transporter substrate-binding protein [Prevotella sp.]